MLDGAWPGPAVWRGRLRVATMVLTVLVVPVLLMLFLLAMERLEMAVGPRDGHPGGADEQLRRRTDGEQPAPSEMW